MMLLFPIIKILGILQASYSAYIGLTKTLKNEDGTLTRYGKIAKNGIVLGLVFSLIGFGVEAYLKKDQKTINPEILEYPIDEFYGYGDFTSNANLFSSTKYSAAYLDYLDSAKKYFYKLQKFPVVKVKNKILGISNGSLANPVNDPRIICSIKIDSLGMPEYIVISPDTLFKNLESVRTFFSLSHRLYFTKNEDIVQKDSIDLDKLDFDLEFSCRFLDFEEIRYYPEKNYYQFNCKYKLTIDKSNAQLKSLYDLSNSYALLKGSNIDYFNSLVLISKGYILKGTYVKTVYSIEISETEDLAKRTIKMAPEYPIQKFNLTVEKN
jgi:hypothetical protein